MGIVFFLLLAIVVLAIIGSTLLGIVLHVVWWAIVGLVVGILARLVLTDARGVGWFQTILFGIAGALLGGVLASAFDLNWFVEAILAVLLAAALIFAFGNSNRRSGSEVTRTR